MSITCGPVTRGQQPKPIAQTIGDPRRTEHTEASRGQLDRKRQAIDAATHISNRRQLIRVIDGSAPPCQVRPIDEQPDSV